MKMRSMTMVEMWASLGSTMASFMFVWAIIQRYCPPELRRYLEKSTNRLTTFFNPYIQISIHEFTGSNLKPHKAYGRVEAYLSVNSSKSAKKLKAEMVKGSSKLVLSIDDHEKVTDEFRGVKVWWVSGKVGSSARPMSMYHPEPEKRYYRLTFHKKHRETVTESYLEHVMQIGKEIRGRSRRRKLYTNSQKHSMWSHIVFKHPATFDTLAMESEKKQDVIEDLLAFTQSKDMYARIGKAWKRGYLLYGPPGTGKSTMIAAMANLLDYDVYDLELTSVRDNTELKRLLIETTSKSIIVIEDIDCSLDLTGQRKKQEKSPEDESIKGKTETPHKEKKEESGSKVTLSGLLNFIDGLWSACGGEKIIVFTTNYVEKLDPALTRRGRMDKHVELSYCSFEGFKVLAKNYLELEAHPMFQSIHRLIEETKITPADVAENLMRKSPREEAEKCLSNLIRALQEAKEAAAKKKGEEESDDIEQANEDAQRKDKQESDKPI
ncbi:unnamed protein product [Ilex paraguariensis]|uniref:AAA+ ATPase domain-containing protein n=1 Tax=Ilex paraguariensis TaxID=185542 RepID=A0ABC8UUM5_9AQUA